MLAEGQGHDRLTLFLAGDVMTGRGLDQILAHPSEPELFEAYVEDARDYVRLAERVSGVIEKPVAPAYPWGDALAELETIAPFARIVNLETSVTTSDDYDVDKGINYRMHPANVSCLGAAKIDCCVLSNNHVLDWGRDGLVETLDVLHAAGLKTAGAGRDWEEAARPAIIERRDDRGRRVLVYGVGSESSGVPPEWAASGDSPGVFLLEDLSSASAERLGRFIAESRRPSDIVVVSIHWGSNWGYAIPRKQTSFAHALIEGGVDIVHGHSSHHPRPIEIYEGKLVLYGAGDLLNDYEGIEGYEGYRGDLSLLYFPTLEWSTGRLVDLRMVPMRICKMQLSRASGEDARWLATRLDEVSRGFGTRIELREDGSLGVLLTAP